MLGYSHQSNLISMPPFPYLAILTARAKLKDIAQGVPLCHVCSLTGLLIGFICKRECFSRPVKGMLDTFEAPLQTWETLRVSLRAITERKWLHSERPWTFIANRNTRHVLYQGMPYYCNRVDGTVSALSDWGQNIQTSTFRASDMHIIIFKCLEKERERHFKVIRMCFLPSWISSSFVYWSVTVIAGFVWQGLGALDVLSSHAIISKPVSCCWNSSLVWAFSILCFNSSNAK